MRPTAVQQRAHFVSLLGEAHVLQDAASLALYGTDWTRRYTSRASLVVRPKTTADVAAILVYCEQHSLAVVPSGGRTGLAGGAVALSGEIVVSLERMNQILAVNTQEMWICAQAGVPLATLQQAAKEAGFFYPMDLGSKGSCQLGGNLGTNAGGLKFIRYGGMRNHVLGMEVVVANGRILELNAGGLQKDNTGYDLKQLFIGSEGTLGIMTQAKIRLMKKPQPYYVALVAVESFPNLLSLMELCRQSVHTLTAFEFFAHAAYGRVQACFPHLGGIFSASYPFYGLIEIEANTVKPGEHPLLSLITEAFSRGWLVDAIFAETTEQFARFWAVRENITESLARSGHVHKNDLTLPLGALGAFMDKVTALTCDTIELLFFGHLGDGNIHINYVGPFALDVTQFQQQVRLIEEQVFSLIQHYRGSISAEHGIGCLKREDLHYSRSAFEVEIMRSIKAVLDPKGILNPGKIFCI